MARIHQVKSARQRRTSDGSLKPNFVCERDGVEIKPGDPYQWVAIMLGPRTSVRRIRCAACPPWAPYELSTALWARGEALTVALSTAIEESDDPDDLQTALDDAIAEIQELAQEKHEAADNLEDGFGHPAELAQIAADLETWAEQLDNLDLPELPEPGDHQDEPTTEQINDWRQDVLDALEPILTDAPN